MFGLGSIWNRLFSGSPVPTTYQSNVPSDPRIQFFELNGAVQWQSLYNPKELIAAYQLCAPISSIINKKATSYAGGELFVKRSSTDKNVRGKYKEWEQLFANPNETQTGRQFFNQLYTYVAINGWSIVLKVYPYGFKDRPAKLYNIPFWFLEIDGAYYNQYMFNYDALLDNLYFCGYDGKRTKLNREDVILITDDTGAYDERTWLPKSRICLLQYPITTWLSAVEAEVTMIQKRGAIGIISPESSADSNGAHILKDSDKEAMQMDFQRYGLSRNQWQQIITNKPIKYQSMTFATKDLLLQESQIGGVKYMCDGYNYPFILLAESDQSTYNNVATADRKLYQDSIIPEANAIDEQLVAGLTKDIYIVHDYCHVPALQAAKKEEAERESVYLDVYKKEYELGIKTRNMILEEMGEDKVPLPEMDLYSWQIKQQEMEQQAKLQIPNNGA